MATTTTITSSYAGKTAGGLFLKTFKEADALKNGILTILPNVNYKVVLRKLATTNGRRDYTCGHVPAGSVTLSEAILEPKKFKDDFDLCKEDFRATWGEESMGASAHNNTMNKEILDAIIANKLADNAEDDFSVSSMEELISTFSSTSEMLTILLVAVASISLLIGGIGIMNIMYVSVKERTKEIGLRMAVGGKGSDILMQFLIEAILISITGGLLGVMLGLGATVFIEYFLDWPTSVAFYSIIISFVVCAVTGIFFGWYPARKASALDPITALRYE